MNNNNDIFICDFFVNEGINEIVLSAAKVGRNSHLLRFALLFYSLVYNFVVHKFEAALEIAIEDLLNQNLLLFLRQIENLTAYQMNFLKVVAKGVHTDFTSKEILATYDFGSKSNVSRIKTTNLCTDQILHPEASRFPHQKLGSRNGTKRKALAIIGLVGEGDFVGRRLGHHAVDAIHLTFSGHVNI